MEELVLTELKDFKVTDSSGDDRDVLWLVNCWNITLLDMSSFWTVNLFAQDWRESFT